jgi:branched-chain amino acid transport system permease protein
MTDIIAQSVVNGLLLGGIYAVVVLGFSLAWRVNGVINLAHGEFVMLGAYLTWALSAARWLAPLPALLVVIPVMFALGYVIERLLLRRVQGRPALVAVLVTLGLSVVLQHGMRIAVTPTPHAVPLPATGVWELGPVNVAVGRGVLLAVSLAIVVGVAVFLRVSRPGRSIRAVAQNPEAAQLVGIDIARVRTLSFALCTAIAGAAGCLVSQAQPIHPGMGPPLLLRAFAVTALAGPGHVAGALGGSGALGVVESLIGTFVPRIGANLGVIVAAVLLVIMLVVRRNSLLTQGEWRWVR